MLAFTLPDAETRNSFWKSCFEVGLLVIRCGERSIRLRPYLDIGADIIAEAMSGMRQAIKRVRA